MNNKKILDRIEQLISKGKECKKEGNFYHDKYAGFQASTLSFVNNIYGENHIYFISIAKKHRGEVEYINEFLESIKEEVETGWFASFKNIVSAEIFESYIDMAEHLLEKKYKDPAAVIIGSTLESKLRQLCKENNIDLETTNHKGKKIPKKASVLNADICKKDVYNKIVEKQVTTWLGLRNSAAHGKYDDYDLAEVKLMYQGVLGFISKYS